MTVQAVMRSLAEVKQSDIGAKVKVRVCVLLTSFNRRQKTLACLESLSNSQGMENVQLSAVLVDDASTDGTAEAVKSAYPWVDLVSGDGSLYWCRGMHMAWDLAKQGKFDHYLWLNDDTMLIPDALSRLLACAEQLRTAGHWPAIVVGSTVDVATGQLTYGGERRAGGWRRMSFIKVAAKDRPEPCDSMNGNVVLIPAEAAEVVGNLDPRFEHAMGDTDYALRAGRLGVGVWVAPGVHATCSHDSLTGTYRDASLSFRQRLRLMLSRKGLPWRSWLLLTRRHAGGVWPMYFCWPYLRFVLDTVRRTPA